MSKRYTVTAALPYTNGPVHIGHLAGVYIPADIYVRYLRKNGKDVAFVCGSDEHGVPITISAKNEGITPQEVVDKYHKIIGDSFKEFGISFDIYHRTSSETHKETAANYFKELYDKGVFLEKTSEQFYDAEADQFLADRYIKGECPKCGNPEAYGDQCEKCGSTLSPDELINPTSALSGNSPIKKETKHWYLPLDQYEPFLKQWILEDHKADWKSNVYGQCKSWLDQGLQPRAVTRDLEWGVPVPVEGADGKVLYVWFDAPIGYISATKDWAKENNKDWEPYWKDEETKLVHFIGKDNIVFHCIIFPSMLKAQGEYILPENVPANEFLNLEGNKISTSKNWAVWLHEYLKDFEGKQDLLRYTLCATAPEKKDNDFTWKGFQLRVKELADNPGNLVNRVLVLTNNYYKGVVPALGQLLDIDKEALAALEKAPQEIAASLERYRFKEALETLMKLSDVGNKYLGDTEPWKLYKKRDEYPENLERIKTIMNIGLQFAASLSILFEPFLPFTAEKLQKHLQLENTDWSYAGSTSLLAEGHQLAEGKLGVLFPKIEDTEVQAQIDRLLKIKEDNEAKIKAAEEVKKPVELKEVVEKDTIQFDDFVKMDIKVGTIIEAEKMKKSKKLLKIKVDMGYEERTVLSGIAESYSPDEIIGQQVCVLANLAPRKMMGVMSQGMILMADDGHGKLAFVAPSRGVLNGEGVS